MCSPCSLAANAGNDSFPAHLRRSKGQSGGDRQSTGVGSGLKKNVKKKVDGKYGVAGENDGGRLTWQQGAEVGRTSGRCITP